MSTKASIWVTTSFVGFHYWSDAPDEVDFLRNVHRHVFHVKVCVEVTHCDRQVEFFLLKKDVNKHCQELFEGRTFPYSCEMIAQSLVGLLNQYKVLWVEVSEDGENGARVEVCHE